MIFQEFCCDFKRDACEKSMICPTEKPAKPVKRTHHAICCQVSLLDRVLSLSQAQNANQPLNQGQQSCRVTEVYYIKNGNCQGIKFGTKSSGENVFGQILDISDK